MRSRHSHSGPCSTPITSPTPKPAPDLAEIALATAQIDGNPLANRPDLLRCAAAEIGTVKDDATPDDVLVYAAGLAAVVA
jgi:hypothetical protein